MGLSFFLKLSSRNFDSLLGSAPVALAIFAAGTSNLSSLALLLLLSRFLDSLSFFDPDSCSPRFLTVPPDNFNFNFGMAGVDPPASCPSFPGLHSGDPDTFILTLGVSLEDPLDLSLSFSFSLSFDFFLSFLCFFSLSLPESSLSLLFSFLCFFSFLSFFYFFYFFFLWSFFSSFFLASLEAFSGLE